MAGAITVVTSNFDTGSGRQSKVWGTLHFSTGYTSGGDTITAAQLGLTTIDELIVDPPLSAGVGVLVPTVVIAANGATALISLWTANTPATTTPLVQNTTSDVHAYVANFHAFGV